MDNFSAAAWCYKVPEELVRHKQLQHIANLHVHLNLLSSLLPGTFSKNVVSLQPLKEVNQEPAAVSDSTVKDKFTELAKALSEQLVDFLMVCIHPHTVCFHALPNHTQCSTWNVLCWLM